MEKVTEENREQIQSEIWVTYHPKIQVYLKQLFPNIMDVGDRTSEILLKVFTKLDQYNPKYAFSTWLYRVARNSQIDEIRKVTLECGDIEDYTPVTEETPESEFLREYDKQSVKDAIDQLKPNQRELIYLYYYEGQNYREISGITGTPIGTLKFRMSCSRKTIRRIMERKEQL